MKSDIILQKTITKNLDKKTFYLNASECLETISIYLQAIYTAIQKGNENFIDLNSYFSSLENFIFEMEKEKPDLASEIITKINLSDKAFLQQAYCKWETELEWQFAQKLMSQDDLSLRYLIKYKLYKRFELLIKHEVSLLSYKPQKVLFIGSGPFPISGILLSQILNVPVDCVDEEPKVVELSQILLKKLGLEDKLRIFCAQAQKFNISPYDLIVIALLAKPKHAILSNIRKNSALNSQVLCRTSLGMRTLLYQPTSIKRIGGFLPNNLQIAEHEQTISTYLLQPTKGISSRLRWHWVNQLDDNLKTGIANLINRVLQKETTIGFSAPLNDREASDLLASLNESLNSGAKNLLIAENENHIVAHLILTPHPLPNCAHQVEVSRVMICPYFRGTRLLNQIAQKLVLKSESLGKSLILLDVREGTLAHALWKDWGFKEYGRLSDYARVNGKKHAGIFMCQEVSSLRTIAFP